jgi:DNA-binding helix-hairpin-helix protein with protein kinase domain
VEIVFSDRSVEQYKDESFSGGAQGEVYRSVDGRSAVKIYNVDPAKEAEHVKRIDILIDDLNPTKGDPYWAEFFAWPEKRVVRRDSQAVVGFRMRYADGLKMLGHYIYSKAFNRLKPEERGWFVGRIAVAIRLASAADRLAKMGLSYPDFADKNIMVDPFDGRMMMIDCDSLSIPGKLPATVVGTPGYCAPEIVMRQVTVPSVQTDRHALAVLLYRWLLIHDPFLGDKKFSPEPAKDDELRYGSQAVYVEHQTDFSNRASKQVLFASMLGPELEKLFRQAFVDGLTQPDRRPLPYQWQRALLHAYDQIIPCASATCLWHAFIAAPTQGARLACPICKTPVERPPVLPFLYLLQHSGMRDPHEYLQNVARAHYIVGWPGKPLCQWHMRPDAMAVYAPPDKVPDSTPQAIFEYDEYAKQWYLKNLSSHALYYQREGEATHSWYECQPQAAIPLHHHLFIQLGTPPTYYRAKVVLMGKF